MDVEAGLRKSTSKYVETGYGYVVRTLAEAQIFTGAYNIFDPISTPPEVLGRFTTNVGRDGKFDQSDMPSSSATESSTRICQRVRSPLVMSIAGKLKDPKQKG